MRVRCLTLTVAAIGQVVPRNAQLNSTTFGEPRQNLLNAYQPRVAQLAFKVGFQKATLTAFVREGPPRCARREQPLGFASAGAAAAS